MDSYLSSVAARSNPRTARFLFSSSGNSPSGRHFTLMNLLCITLHGAVYNRLLEKARKKYIKLVRIRHAKQLLMSSGKKISEIYLLVGYDDEKYFSRVFKEMEKISANDYRKKFSNK